MKKLYLIFTVLFATNAFALYTDAIVNGCDNPKNFYPVFQINSYTCNSGYFLPADTLGCQLCPSGHICSGGTFNYNPTLSQGIIFNRPTNTNIAKGCSTNFGTRLLPIFQPNTVTLNYDDGTGNTTSTTCTYNGLVNLPAPPNRDGYTFNGWKLQSNNNQ